MTQEESMFQLECEGRKKPPLKSCQPRSVLLLGGRSPFLFYPRLQLLMSLSTVGKVICSPNATHFNVNPKTSHSKVWPKVGALCRLVKLSHKIKHHKTLNICGKLHNYTVYFSIHGFPCCSLIKDVSVGRYPGGYTVNTLQCTWDSCLGSISIGQFP